MAFTHESLHSDCVHSTELSGVWPVAGTQEGLGMLRTIISLFFSKKKYISGMVLMSSLLEYHTTFLQKC